LGQPLRAGFGLRTARLRQLMAAGLNVFAPLQFSLAFASRVFFGRFFFRLF